MAAAVALSTRGGGTLPRVEYLESLRWLLTLPDFERTGQFAGRPDVALTRALLAELGDPHLGRPTVHIAGSKGKGSTGAMIEGMLRAAGRSTGFFASPHLHHYSERIRLDGAAADEGAFAAAMTVARDAMSHVEARMPERQFVAFDALTAAAFVAFREAGVDVQVVEVGLGGTLDPTNVFDEPDVIVLTPISLEHTAILGTTIAAIAEQKAGIIKPRSTVVIAPQRESALDVFRRVARERDARVVEVAEACRLSRTSATGEGQEFKLKTPRAAYQARLPLAGRHQLDNAVTAVLACEELAARAGFAFEPQHAREGLAGLSWPGRLEVLDRRPLLIIDGAHNGDSAKRMVQALGEHFGLRQCVFLFGTLEGKDVAGMAAAVASVASDVFATAWLHPRAADPAPLVEAFRALDVPVTAFGNLAQAYDSARAEAGERGAVVAFGALAFVAAVREYHLGIESDMIRLAATARIRQDPAAS